MLWSNHRDGSYSCKNPKFTAEKENANDPRKRLKIVIINKVILSHSFSAFKRTDIIEGIWDTTVITVTDGLSKEASLFTSHM